MRLIACICLALASAASAASSRLIVARGAWASFDRGAACGHHSPLCFQPGHVGDVAL